MRRTLIPAALAAVLVVPALSGLSTASTAPALDGSVKVQLFRNLLPGIASLSGTQADPSKVLSIGVALQRPDVAGEDALLKALYDPTSPEYRHFPTVAELDARFGVPQARVDLATRTLRDAGVTVDKVSSGGEYISAHGTIASLEKAFSVDIKSFDVDGTPFVANTTGPIVPQATGIFDVVGLNTRQHFTLDGSVRPAQSGCRAGICMGNTTPQDLWSTYDQPAAHRGRGVTIGIIGEGNPKATLADLPKQEKVYGLPIAATKVICVQGGDCGTDTTGDPEWRIDTQASLGMAPDASEDLYFAKSIYDGDLNNSFISWVEDPKGPTIASASLGECEAGPANGIFVSPPLDMINGNLTSLPSVPVPVVGDVGGGGLAIGNGEAAAVDPELKKAVMAGKTLFASTGDTGSSCPLVYAPVVGGGNGVANQGVPQQNYPAVSVYAMAVGGTVLYTDDNGEGSGTSYKAGQAPATRNQEYSWTFGGGGPSLYSPEPAWEALEPNINRPCVIGVDGSPAATGQTCRGVPDVAAQSGDVATNGYSIADSSSSTGFGSGAGTSLSSPLWAGMWARVVGASGAPIGFAAPAIYAKATIADDYPLMFTDVTCCVNGAYTSGPNWDYNTGFGTPLVSGLIKLLATAPSLKAPALDAVKTLTLTATKGSVRYGSKLTLKGRLALGTVGIPKEKLTIKGRTDDGRTSTLKTVTTDSKGAWSYTFRPSRDEVYSVSGDGLTQKLAKIPTTLTFPQLRGTALDGVLSVSGSISPGYELSSKRHETVSIYRLSADGKHTLKLLGRVNASNLTTRRGSPLGINRFALTVKVPKGSYKVGIKVSDMPLNAGGVAARFSVKV